MYKDRGSGEEENDGQMHDQKTDSDCKRKEARNDQQGISINEKRLRCEVRHSLCETKNEEKAKTLV